MPDRETPAYLDDFLTFDDPETSDFLERLEMLAITTLRAKDAGRLTYRVDASTDERPWNRLPIPVQALITAVERWSQTSKTM